MVSFLDDLGQKHGTDKARGSHNYLVWYEHYFAPMKHLPINFMEMGVASGASLFTWRDYFANAQIVGMDIEDKTQYNGNRIITVKGDQSVAEDLDRVLAAVSAPYNIINDDAGHQEDHQLFAFKYLLPHLAPGGLYVLEDIGGSRVSEFLTSLAKHVVHDTWNNDSDEWVNKNGPRIESVSFYRETSITIMKN